MKRFIHAVMVNVATAAFIFSFVMEAFDCPDDEVIEALRVFYWRVAEWKP